MTEENFCFDNFQNHWLSQFTCMWTLVISTGQHTQIHAYKANKQTYTRMERSHSIMLTKARNEVCTVGDSYMIADHSFHHTALFISGGQKMIMIK